MNYYMRIGEIAILGPDVDNKQRFIQAVSDSIDIQDNTLTFGRLQINSQLVVHLYGLTIREHKLNSSWDLVSKKLLGYIVLFNWNNPESFSDAKSIIEFLTTRYSMPLVIAANLNNSTNLIPRELINFGINIADQEHFTFCKVSEPESIRRVLLLLLNVIIEKLS